ncbi:putative Phosphate transport system protein phoU [Desulfamplus magnetovallimortis]|uniref:Phosphate-specific transport system accessory protein PhoU n=1 Tax=Desulfamplus magnetovallimortis TaxID=1246637 RepID=A0A1W1HE40_9BACT|nr:phosphate signaling complex protein PhoU [Desulfamplus magnetovallimortis]SLM30761.1 putative Phosphate transport system protein phoU [Desulfamplus magnetovallimortis]
MQNPHMFKGFDKELEVLNNKISTMANECELQLIKSVDALTSLDSELAKYIIKRDKIINEMHLEIEQLAISMISIREPKASDLRYVIAGFKIASELERVGDYAANISKHITKLQKLDLDGPVDCIILMARTASKMIRGAMEALTDKNAEKAYEVWQMDDEIDHNYSRLLRLVRQSMREKPENQDDSTTLMFMGRCCERIGDHITNIAEGIYYVKTGSTCIECIEI